jgi:hypothetical protein
MHSEAHTYLYRGHDWLTEFIVSYTENLALPGLATGWTMRVLGFDSRWGLGIFLFTTASRTALEPTQPPIQWVLGALSLGIKRPGREAIHPLPQYAFMAWCLVKAQGQLYLYLETGISYPNRGLDLEDRGSYVLPILPQHYKASQPRRPWIESSPPWKLQISHKE